MPYDTNLPKVGIVETIQNRLAERRARRQRLNIVSMIARNPERRSRQEVVCSHLQQSTERYMQAWKGGKPVEVIDELQIAMLKDTFDYVAAFEPGRVHLRYMTTIIIAFDALINAGHNVFSGIAGEVIPPNEIVNYGEAVLARQAGDRVVIEPTQDENDMVRSMLEAHDITHFGDTSLTTGTMDFRC